MRALANQQYSQQEFNIRRRLDSEDASCSSETSKHTSGFSTEMALLVASLLFTIGVYFCNLDKQMKFLWSQQRIDFLE